MRFFQLVRLTFDDKIVSPMFELPFFQFSKNYESARIFMDVLVYANMCSGAKLYTENTKEKKNERLKENRLKKDGGMGRKKL